jgi:hypothetical protein
MTRPGPPEDVAAKPANTASYGLGERVSRKLCKATLVELPHPS